IVFALDSIPAVLSVTQETFIVITSNIFAIMGLRSLYFVLAGAMAKFEYLKLSLAVLLIAIGAKMILDAAGIYDMPQWMSLAMIAVILGIGVVASVIASKPPADAPEGQGPLETVGEVGGDAPPESMSATLDGTKKAPKR